MAAEPSLEIVPGDPALRRKVLAAGLGVVVALLAAIVWGPRLLGSQRRFELRRRPCVVRPFPDRIVRVHGGVERPFGSPQRPEQILEDRTCSVTPLGVSRHLPGCQVHVRELGVVVQHLLEMRDLPCGVGRVTMETATQLIPDSTAHHPSECLLHHHEGGRCSGPPMVSQQKLETRRHGELRSASKAAVLSIERTEIAREGRVEHGTSRRLVGRAHARRRMDTRRQGTPVGDDAGWIGAVGFGEMPQQ